MINLRAIKAIALDISGASDSFERQEEITDFIWCLLERNYKIFLLSTDIKDDLSQEDFNHPGMRYLREEMPPSQKNLREHSELSSVHTLWVTEDIDLQKWVGTIGAAVGHQGERVPKEVTYAIRYTRLSELSVLLDPTGFVMSDLTRMVVDLRRSHPDKPLIIGIGGPPLSEFQTFALAMREHLQDTGFDLVELMDFSSLLRSTDQVLTETHHRSTPWTGPGIGTWVETDLLQRFREGGEVYYESHPSESPEAFIPHFPFFLSRESVLLMFAELLFTSEISGVLDLSILLEMSPEETTRRLYEIPTLEAFDDKFTEQYLAREGRVYEQYLQKHKVIDKAVVRIDANNPAAMHIIPPNPPHLN